MKNEKNCKTPLICKDGGLYWGSGVGPVPKLMCPTVARFDTISIQLGVKEKKSYKDQKVLFNVPFYFPYTSPYFQFLEPFGKVLLMIVPFSRYYDFYFIFCYINARRMALCLLSTKDKQFHIKIKDLFSQLRDNYHVKIGLLEVLFRQCTGGWSTNYSPDIN